MRDKSAEPYEMEKSREGSGSKNIQIKEGVFQVERHQTGKITTGTRESLEVSLEKIWDQNFLGQPLLGQWFSSGDILGCQNCVVRHFWGVVAEGKDMLNVLCCTGQLPSPSPSNIDSSD